MNKTVRVILPLLMIQISLSQTRFSDKIDNFDKKFSKFFAITIPEKDDYETQDEYQRRIPHWDASKVICLELQLKVSYDVDQQTQKYCLGDFGFCGGGDFRPFVCNINFGRSQEAPVKLIYRITRIHIDSIAVHPSFDSAYTVIGDDFWANNITSDSNSIEITRHIDPVRGKTLSKSLKAVGYFRLKDYDHRDVDFDSQSMGLLRKIDGQIDKIVLYKTDDKMIVVSIQIY